MESIYVVMPAYNEEANIEAVVKQWYSVLLGKDEKSRLVIADSGSSDNTHEILNKLQTEYPKLEIYTDCDKQHGPKLIALYDFAIANDIDIFSRQIRTVRPIPKSLTDFGMTERCMTESSETERYVATASQEHLSRKLYVFL